MRNLSHPARRTLDPDRGDYVKTDGGAIGLYIGTTAPGGVQVIYYAQGARQVFARACQDFDLAQRARDRVEILRRARLEADGAFGLGLTRVALQNTITPLRRRAFGLGSDYREGRVQWTGHETDPAGGFNCMCAACRLERQVQEATP